MLLVLGGVPIGELAMGYALNPYGRIPPLLGLAVAMAAMAIAGPRSPHLRDL